jgi:hypothetical protein
MTYGPRIFFACVWLGASVATATAGVKTFEASAGGHKVVLPVDAEVKVWAVRCR